MAYVGFLRILETMSRMRWEGLRALRFGSVAGVAGMEGAPDLLDSFNFFSLSAYVVRTAEKFCHHRENC